MRSKLLASVLCLSMCGSFVAPLAHAEPSKEDVANAKALAKEGRELREKGKYKEALVKFEAAWAYVQTPLTGRDLAQEYERDGKLVEARVVWSEVAKMSAKPGDTKEHADARAQGAAKLGELDARIPTVLIQVKGSDAPKVTLDGKDVPLATLGTSRRVNPGAHTLSATAGGDPTSTSFSVKEGERDRLVSLVVVGPGLPTQPVTPPPPTTDTSTSGTPSAKPSPTGDGPGKFTEAPVPPAARQHESGTSGLAITGGVFTALGIVGVLGGGLTLAYGITQRQDGKDSSGTMTLGYGVLGGGSLFFLTGVIMIGVGTSKTTAAARPLVHVAVSPQGFALAGQF